MLENAIDLCEHPLPVFRVNQVDHLHADQFLLRISQKVLAGGADKDIAALGIDQADHVKQQVYDLVEIRLRIRAHTRELAGMWAWCSIPEFRAI